MALGERSLVEIALRDLGSEECYCGGPKKPKSSFCPKCYYALPSTTRHALYKTMSDGYAEIYDRAKEYLRCETDRIPPKR